MKIYEIYFSPTGGTKKAAESLASGLNGDIETVDLTDYKADFQSVTLQAEDVAIIAVPSYGGRAPATAIERISKIKGNGARAILACAYGNRAFEDTLAELQDTVCGAGFCVIAAVGAVAEHSIARKFAEGRPNSEDRAQLAEFAGKIQRKISADDSAVPSIPGNRPYKKLSNMAMTPKPTKDCVQCGLCAEKCPVQAIDAKNVDKVDSKKCISCMRCVSVCPHSARKISGVMMAAANAMLKKTCSDHKNNELFI